MKNYPKNCKTILSLFLVLCSLFIINCEIDHDYLKKIDDEVAWHNAARLEVNITFLTEWGSSNPPQGTITPTIDIRKGYEFNLEFISSSGYSFVNWLAFNKDDFDLTILTIDYDDALALSLNGKGVEVSIGVPNSSGVIPANIKIDITTPVILVPFCDTRPRITLTNPPLINTGASYSLGQTVTIFFSEPGLDYEDGELTDFFDDGFIQIRGQTINEPLVFYDDLSDCFHLPQYNDNLRRITIQPNNLPMEELVITVTVGTKVQGKNGNTMAAPVSFSWRTNTETVTDKYIAENIWAIHNPAAAASELNFFYPRAMLNTGSNYRDARLRKNTQGNYEVTLYFSIRASNDEMDTPTHCIVQEYRAFNAAGNNVSNDGAAATYSITPITTTSTDTAANIYRAANNNIRTFKIIHELQTPEAPMGIWRFVLTPYREEGSEKVGLDQWGNAHAESSYASVVLNEALPAGNAALTLNTQMSGTGIYSYGAGNTSMNFDVNFNYVSNSWMNSGITRDNASLERPWTIDPFNEIDWQWRIVNSSGAAIHSPALWLSTNIRSINNVNLTAIGSSQDIRSIQVRYRDKLNRESIWIETGARLTYYVANYDDVSAYSAIYDPDANTITVSWINPTQTDFERVEVWYRVNDMNITVPTVVDTIAAPGVNNPKGNRFIISNVPRLNTTGVRDGLPVSNSHCYEIFMRTHSAVDSRDVVSFKIWNFGTPTVPATDGKPAIPGNGMRTGTATGFTLAIEVTGPTGVFNENTRTIGLSSIATNNLNAQYVLANSFSVTSHTPIGTFTGNFFGNGHTITINSMNAATYMGLFGIMDGGTVRDLTVNYNNNVEIEFSGTRVENNASFFGGISAIVRGNAHLENVIVRGSVTLNGNGFTAFAGGLAGLMGRLDSEIISTASINKAYGGLNLTVDINPGVDNSLYVGGITGSMGTPSTTFEGGDPVLVNEARVTGDIIVGRTSPVDVGTTIHANESIVMIKNVSGLYVGGIIGFIQGAGNEDPSSAVTERRALLSNSEYRQGSITINNREGLARLGGAVGALQAYANIIGCSSAASNFEINKTGDGTDFYVGGFIGNSKVYGIIQNCYNEGPVAVNSLGASYTTAGGFIGGTHNLYAVGYGDDMKIEYCYAIKGNISVIGKRSSIGGFIGAMGQDTTIQFCFAAGDVSLVTLDSTGNTFAGGFGGTISNINDCYATGNVFANWQSTVISAINAGGFVGSNQAGITERNFTTGNVILERSNNGQMRAGGFAGAYMNELVLRNNAALGSSITAIGNVSNANLLIGRIAGIGQIPSNTTSTNYTNHAYNGMRLYYSNTFPSPRPTEITYAELDPAPADLNKNGRDTSLSDFRRRTFWTRPAPAQNEVFNPAIHGMGFSADNWIFTTVESRGHPILWGPIPEDGSPRRPLGGQ